MRSWPAVRTAVRENRAFLGRAVRYLAGAAGIRQFLDIGAGLPSASNVHEVAQAVAPESRVVYVDNDHFKLGCAHAPRKPVTRPPDQRLGAPGGRRSSRRPATRGHRGGAGRARGRAARRLLEAVTGVPADCPDLTLESGTRCIRPGRL